MCVLQETAQRERLLSTLQEDRERLQTSHTVQLEKLRLQLNTQIQKMQLTNSRKVRPDRHTHLLTIHCWPAKWVLNGWIWWNKCLQYMDWNSIFSFSKTISTVYQITHLISSIRSRSCRIWQIRWSWEPKSWRARRPCYRPRSSIPYSMFY